MNRILPALLAAVSLAAPAYAGAGLGDARGAAENPSSFDGARVHPGAEPVRPDANADKRTPGEIAAEEQAKADARRSPAPAIGAAPEPAPVAPNPESEPADGNGPLYGLAGLGVGALFGGLLAAGLSRLNA